MKRSFCPHFLKYSFKQSLHFQNDISRENEEELNVTEIQIEQ